MGERRVVAVGLVVLAVLGCSSSDAGSGKGGSAGSSGAAGSGTGNASGAAGIGGAAAGSGSGPLVTGPSCPDGITALILGQSFPMPAAACKAFVEKVCPGELEECSTTWCGSYFTCACACADNDLDCYAACGYTSDCASSLDTITECGIGIRFTTVVATNSPCYPPMSP